MNHVMYLPGTREFAGLLPYHRGQQKDLVLEALFHKQHQRVATTLLVRTVHSLDWDRISPLV